MEATLAASRPPDRARTSHHVTYRKLSPHLCSPCSTRKGTLAATTSVTSNVPGPCFCTLCCGQESEAGELVVSNTCRVTASQLREFLRRSLDKYKRALVEPGEVSSEIETFFEQAVTGQVLAKRGGVAARRAPRDCRLYPSHTATKKRSAYIWSYRTPKLPLFVASGVNVLDVTDTTLEDRIVIERVPLPARPRSKQTSKAGCQDNVCRNPLCCFSLRWHWLYVVETMWKCLLCFAP